MPMNRRRYPADWGAIALRIKDLAQWRCQGCGQVCRRPGESWAKFCDRTGVLLCMEPSRYTLTVAHLNHEPMDCRDENLRAWCFPCHGRHDIRPAAIARKRMLKREYHGQLRLF
ncbi:MAG: HNH endonuclease [Leptolyngbya sp. SIO4C5]|nr:HNH endonuclease [Leptolyngbya sp. SIO4C5]